ncbi:MAG: hypothetical protein E6J10_10900 [Chloroflexi bacterium]|nr:MAG: hypothetical protein E6J10_10900 [Chloroflexota bacterium]
MRSTTKTPDPTIIIIPKQAKPQTDDMRRRKRPRLLTVLLSLLALIAFIHFIAVIHGTNPVVMPSNCPGLIRTTDYIKMPSMYMCMVVPCSSIILN